MHTQHRKLDGWIERQVVLILLEGSISRQTDSANMILFAPSNCGVLYL
jgi:hypothetical protein